MASWQIALRTAWLEFLTAEAFEWGRVDCCQFVRRYLQLKVGQELTGKVEKSIPARRGHKDL